MRWTRSKALLGLASLRWTACWRHSGYSPTPSTIPVVVKHAQTRLRIYDAEPDDESDSQAVGTVVAKVADDGNLYGDVEGVRLVAGSDSQKGFIIVSCQGVSAYSVYRRAPPHEYVTTFTLVEASDGKVNAVSNTDGVAAVGTALSPEFPFGIIATHDDANQLPNGSTSNLASFKMTSLSKILGAQQLKQLRLLDDVDADWDPRTSARHGKYHHGQLVDPSVDRPSSSSPVHTGR
ncbi:3-phytase [Purpureocillium takamizusanense]|uniref:3-phytase n=1 Tax=Purpureocillium takamizusanense TaxID=2060973 RepID=A0A9Q8QDT7_9HYPO|nr:3-phytase [Purpureocillium takamizusanense]UNI17129.1 3-phytase [Purpureocillium takamizusanense]